MYKVHFVNFKLFAIKYLIANDMLHLWKHLHLFKSHIHIDNQEGQMNYFFKIVVSHSFTTIRRKDSIQID